MTAYHRLTERFIRIATLGEAASLLGWDAATMMPPGGGAARGDQLAVLAGLSHSLLCAPDLGDDLAAAEADAETLDPWQQANLRLMRKMYVRATALPRDLVEAQARANSACEKIWREARRASDFAGVRQTFAEVVRLVREAAMALAPVVGLSPYDALMDGFQHGARAATVAPVFADYERFLRRALPQAEQRQARQPTPNSAARPVPDCRAGSALPPAVGTPRARFQPCEAGPLGASVLRRHAHRRAHHHALRRGGLRPRGTRGGA